MELHAPCIMLIRTIAVLAVTAQVAVGVRPCVAATWDFGAIAVRESAASLCRTDTTSTQMSLDAVVAGIAAVEQDTQAQYFVGRGGLPNALGQMEFDAAVMDADLQYGAVLGLQKVSSAVAVARTVLERSPHNVIVGDGALRWALANGFATDPDDALTAASRAEWRQWQKSHPAAAGVKDKDCHDTVGVICLDREGRLAVGTSTSGWKYKHPGRVGDAPLVGSGLYCDGDIGAAVATGDGEEIMRICLSFLVVEYMRQGAAIDAACRMGIERVQQLHRMNHGMHDEELIVGVIAMDPTGTVGAASTLDDQQPHRGRPYFPVVCWRSQDEKEIVTLQATTKGIIY